MISGHGTIETAVQAIKYGAYDFLEKPFKADRLLLVLERAIEAARLKRENAELRLRAGGDLELIGASHGASQVRQQVERVAPPQGAPPGTPPTTRLSVLTFSENSVDLARTSRGEENRYRNAQERSLGELLNPDPAERIPDRDLRRFRAEAHNRLASPISALGFALVAMATALTGQFRRHGGGFRLFTGIAVVVGLLAIGLMTSNLAARQNAMIPLIWVHAVLPGLVAAWVLSGMPGLPQQFLRRRAAGAAAP
jgi:lipopolysaccharide export system permease protein